MNTFTNETANEFARILRSIAMCLDEKDEIDDALKDHLEEGKKITGLNTSYIKTLAVHKRKKDLEDKIKELQDKKDTLDFIEDVEVNSRVNDISS